MLPLTYCVLIAPGISMPGGPPLVPLSTGQSRSSSKSCGGNSRALAEAWGTAWKTLGYGLQDCSIGTHYLGVLANSIAVLEGGYRWARSQCLQGLNHWVWSSLLVPLLLRTPEPVYGARGQKRLLWLLYQVQQRHLWAEQFL